MSLHSWNGSRGQILAYYSWHHTFWTLFSWLLKTLLSLIHSPHSRQCTPFLDVPQIMSTFSFKIFQWLLIVLRIKSSLLFMACRKREPLYGLTSAFLWASSLVSDLELHWPHFCLFNGPVLVPVVCSLCLVHLVPHHLSLSSNITCSERPPLTYLSKVSPVLFPSCFLMSLLYFLIAPFTIWYSLYVYLSIVSVLRESRAGTMSVVFTSVFSVLGPEPGI